ncbi:MAG: acyl carrier protein [Clostridiales bacterium]|jgi:acyl carrier protein|nr:acyl carrier protein [Clostridiales bacterium]
MLKEEIFAKTLAVFRDVFDDNELEINETTTSSDIDGWDSLMHMQLIAEIESAFETEFTLGEIQGLKNVGDLLSVVAKYKG